MKVMYRKTSLLLITAIAVMLLFTQVVWAASPTVQQVRYRLAPEKVRIVFDMDALPDYNVTLINKDPNKPDEYSQLVIEMQGAIKPDVLPEMAFNDPVVGGLHLSETEQGNIRAAIDLKAAVMYKVFTLSGPNRLVIDIIKGYGQKIQQEIMPGINYTYWFYGTQVGPIAAHILDVNPQNGLIMKPVLSNNAIHGLETLSPMAERAGAIAAVNGSYFALNGDILGLLKIDGQIVSTPGLPRTAMGVLPDGQLIIDQVDYKGSVEIPGGQVVQINGVDCERGPDSLVLYNEKYNTSTNSNQYGIEYSIVDDKVAAISPYNTPIVPGSVVLSAHGAAAKALCNLKVGDKVKITQTLGSDVWDKTVFALGAGPMLVKDGNVFLTTKTEEFGSDVAGGRAPRTALGLTKDGHIILAVIDGRQSHSVGLTLLELARFMQELGAVDAMNLDGGGSSEMVVDGKIVNKPSDGRERRVGDALVIISARLAN